MLRTSTGRALRRAEVTAETGSLDRAFLHLSSGPCRWLRVASSPASRVVDAIDAYFRYGVPGAGPDLAAGAALWEDEAHVVETHSFYRISSRSRNASLAIVSGQTARPVASSLAGGGRWAKRQRAVERAGIRCLPAATCARRWRAEIPVIFLEGRPDLWARDYRACPGPSVEVLG